MSRDARRHSIRRRPAPGGPGFGHVAALDGVRGVAVAGVVAFHLGHLQGGFLGVDLFFVLSGFLITSLLVGEWGRTARIDLPAFWSRRAHRLLPALFLVLLAAAAYAAFAARPTELGAIRRDAIASLAYVANWAQLAAGRAYFDSFSAPSPLEHTWSLAIEEQFYVVWPLVVAAVLWFGRGSLRVLGLVTAVLAVASIGVLQWRAGERDLARAYLGSDTRAAAILYGALGAIVLVAWGRRAEVRVPRWTALPCFLVALGLGAAWTTATGMSGWLYRWGFPVTGVATAAVLVVLAAGGGGVVRRALEVRPLRHLGAISYGLYLWHWPVDVFVTADRFAVHGWPLLVARLGASLLLAELSFVAVERPVRQGLRLGRRPVLVPIGVAVALGVVAVVATVGARSVAPPPVLAAPAAPAVDGATASSAATPAGMRVLVVGDSGAAYLGPGMAAVADQLAARAGGPVVVDGFGEVGCGLPRVGAGVGGGGAPMILDPAGCHQWPDRWAAEVARFAPDVALLNLAWPGEGDRPVPGGGARPCDPGFDAYYRGEAEAAIDVLAARGAKVAVTTVPYAEVFGAAPGRVDCLNATYRAAVAARPGTLLVDLAGWLCTGTRCRSRDGAVVLREDGVHFSGDGALVAGRFVLDRLLAATGR